MTLLRPVVTTAEDGTIERLEITQEAFSDGASLRPHRMGVAGYSLTEEGTLAQVFREELDVDGASTLARPLRASLARTSSWSTTVTSATRRCAWTSSPWPSRSLTSPSSRIP